MKPSTQRLLAVLLGIAGLSILVWLVLNVQFTSWDFRNNIWAPAVLLWHRQPAYAIQGLYPDSNAVWFPQIIGIFFPLGLLPQYPATNLWLAFNILILVALICFIHWLVRGEGPKPLTFAILAMTAFLFPPTIRLLILGQADGILLMGIIAGTFAIERDHYTLGGFLFAVALAKPQQCLLVLAGIIFYLSLVRKKWKAALKWVFVTCLWGLALAIPLWMSNAHWVGSFLSNLRQNPNWSQPSLFSLLHNRLGVAGLVLWCLLFTATLVLSLWIWSKYGPIQAVFWSLALTTLVSPYEWSWDFVLLLPVLLSTALRLSSTLSRLILPVFYVAGFILCLYELQFLGHDDSVIWWFPFLMMAGILLALQTSKINIRREKAGLGLP